MNAKQLVKMCVHNQLLPWVRLQT